ncbi:MAG: hypothetical protein PHH77_00060 [Victivallaceae bacterium]|nr:hypothetical protein [Victivallaceae bacterium]
MNEYELSLDRVFFFDTQIVVEDKRRYIASIVWLYNFQWHSWVLGMDDDEVLAGQWNQADAVVSFNENARLMALMKSEFNLTHNSYINLVDYCDNRLTDAAAEIGIDYPPELEHFDEALATRWWTDFDRGNNDALNSLLFLGAWNTALIYKIFFRACEGTVPVEVSIPFAPGILDSPAQKPAEEAKTSDETLYQTLQNSYDFSGPGDLLQ